MRGLVRELLTAFIVLTVLYLVLLHSTGFGRDVGAVGNFVMGTWKVAQGR